MVIAIIDGVLSHVAVNVCMSPRLLGAFLADFRTGWETSQMHSPMDVAHINQGVSTLRSIFTVDWVRKAIDNE